MNSGATDEDLLQIIRAALVSVLGRHELWNVALQAELSSLGIDSLQAIEVAVHLEDQLGLRFPESGLVAAGTVEGLVVALKKELEKREAPCS